jgi:hypothetical protein
LFPYVSLLVFFFFAFCFSSLFAFGLAVLACFSSFLQCVLCVSFSLSVLVLLLAAHRYMHYANHYRRVALKVITLMFVDKIRDFRGRKYSLSCSSVGRLL